MESGEEGLGVVRICGGESIVAVQLGTRVVTIWSSKEEIGRLHSFDFRNHEGMERNRVVNIKVTRNKVVLLLTDGRSSTNQLVVLQEGEHNWENKILEPFTTQRWGDQLAVDKDWWAVVWWEEPRPDTLKVKLWREELFRRDIELPGVRADYLQDVVLESPFLVVSGRSWSDGSWIKV